MTNVRLGENATKTPITSDGIRTSFRGFFYIYTLRDSDGNELKDFFRPDVLNPTGAERRSLLLKKWMEHGLKIVDVVLVNESEWYTSRLDYDVEVYKDVSKNLSDIEEDYCNGNIPEEVYHLVKGAFSALKNTTERRIIRGVRHMECYEIDINNELAIEVYNSKSED